MSKATKQTIDLTTKAKAFVVNHFRTLVSSLGRLYQSLGSSLMTLAVIAIALALPAGFYVVLDNAKRLSGNWDSATKISLYLYPNTEDADGRALAKRLKRRDDVATTHYISKEAGLELFKRQSGVAEVLEGLNENPLPAVIEVIPTEVNKQRGDTPAHVDADSQAIDLSADLHGSSASSQAINTADPITVLKTDLANLPQVEQVKLDMQWIRRLVAIMDAVQRGLFILATLLCLAVIMVVGNTIRLDIQNRAREIRVQKLIGATDNFIRRPFLYTGVWYGLLGGVLAWLVVFVSLRALSQPIARLASEYQSDFSLHPLSFGAGTLMLILSMGMGLLGSWLAVGRHLKRIEPGQ